MTTEILYKNDVIINPKTQRPIKVGSGTWRKLVVEGLVKGAYHDPKQLAKIDEKNVEKQRSELSKQLPSTLQVVKGRGRYTGQLVTRHRRPNASEISQYTAKKAAQILADNIEDLHGMDEESGLADKLEKLIMTEMVNDLGSMERRTKQRVKPEPDQPKRGAGRPKKPKTFMTKKPTQKYDETTATDMESDEDDHVDDTDDTTTYFTS